MYISHHMTPLTSHIRGHLLYLILPHQVSHTCMAFPFPSADFLDPWDHFLTFDVSYTIPKNMLKFPYGNLNPLSRIYVGLTSKTVYMGMCAKIQIILEFSLMWI